MAPACIEGDWLMLNLGIRKSSLQRIRSRNPNEQERGGENDEGIVNSQDISKKGDSEGA